MIWSTNKTIKDWNSDQLKNWAKLYFGRSVKFKIIKNTSIMKKKSTNFLFLLIVLFTVSFSASSQIYVKIRPTYRVIARPVQPSPQYIWVEEDWAPNGNDYRYSGGYWAPVQQGYYRRQGYWRKSNRGQVWIPGSWGKKSGKGKGHGKH